MPMLTPTNTSASSITNGPDKRVVHTFGDGDGVVLVDEVLAEHDELVAAEPSDGVGRAQRRLQTLGDGDEQTVAEPVAERVVHHLEVVEIEEQHGDASVSTARAT